MSIWSWQMRSALVLLQYAYAIMIEDIQPATQQQCRFVIFLKWLRGQLLVFMVCQLLSRYLGNCFYSVDSLCCFAMKGNKYIYYSPYRRKDGGYYFRTAFASRHSKTNGIENIIKCSMFLSLVFLEHTSSLLYHFLFHSKQSPLPLTLVSNLIPNYFECNQKRKLHSL